MSRLIRFGALIAGVLLLALFLALRDRDGPSSSSTPLSASGTPPKTSPVSGSSSPTPLPPPSPSQEETKTAAAPSPAAETASTEDPVPAGLTGFSLEVVDDHGEAVPGAIVQVQWADARSASAAGSDAVSELLFRRFPMTAKPLVFGLLPREADGIRLRAFGAAEGFPPFSGPDFEIHAGRIEMVRLIASPGRVADIIVVDSTTDQPVPGASVVSVTDAALRSAMELPTLPASVTGGDGRARIEGLGAEDQDLEINARGYLQGRATWSGSELRVRLEPQVGNCTITVLVLGPNGNPVPGLRVWLVGTNRVERTNGNGTVVFTEAAPGFNMVSLDETDWANATMAGKWPEIGYRDIAETHSVDGKEYELLLGVVPQGTCSIDATLVDDRGAPIGGARVKVFDTGNAELEATTDAGGHVRFGPLPGGEYLTRVSLGPNADWYLDATVVEDGENATVIWTLGSATIRGRLVKGPDRRGVSGVTIWFRGKADGTTETGPNGQFLMPRALAGTYEVDASSENSAALDSTLTVPMREEAIIELKELGRVALRFAEYDRARLRTAEVWLYEAGGKIDIVTKFEQGTGEEDLVADGLAPGSYEVEVTIGEAEIRFPVEVKGGKTTTLEVHGP